MPPPLPPHSLDGGGEDFRDSMVWGGGEGQTGSVSDQPGLVENVLAHGRGLERDVL